MSMGIPLFDVPSAATATGRAFEKMPTLMLAGTLFMEAEELSKKELHELRAVGSVSPTDVERAAADAMAVETDVMDANVIVSSREDCGAAHGRAL
jgi:hypothetical protein